MLLKVQNIVVYYGHKIALSNISLEVEAGEIVALLGNNGAGKSTTLKAICGLVPLRSGEITLEGRILNNVSTKDIVAMGVACVPEGRRVFTEMTVLENLYLGGYIRRKRKDELKKDLDWIFGMFPRLRERSGQLAGSLSGGEQQMLAIGRALMSRPRLLILDEPSLGIAPLVVEQVVETIKELNKQGTTIILVEQNADLALKLAHRAYLLASGKIVMEGKSDAFLDNEEVVHAYLGSAKISRSEGEILT